MDSIQLRRPQDTSKLPSYTNSSSLNTVLTHYTRELFDIVCNIYQEDIIRFNYTQEVELLSQLFIT